MYNIAHLDLRQMLGSLRTHGTPAVQLSQVTLPEWPFVTISRQAGAGGITVGRLLAQRLNAGGIDEHPWQCLDRELVERIAADHHLSADLVESLEQSSHTWISEFFSGLSLSDQSSPSELAVFRRVVETMRALALAGHVILVGLGGVYITGGMRKGIHVRVIAPLEWRIANVARLENLTPRDARERVKLLDHNRAAFFTRYWPNMPLTAERFHLTLNAGMLSDEQMVDCLVPLLVTMPSVRPSMANET